MAFSPGGLFGDNSSGYEDYASYMEGIGKRFDPWINRGNQAGQILFDQSGRLVNDPNNLQDQIASGFDESPFQRYLLDQVTKRMNINAANTGMLGGGAADRALQAELNNMTGQFLNDYITRGIGTYTTGLNTMGMLDERGLQALNAMAPILENAGAARLKGSQSRNVGWNKLIAGVGGAASGFITGGVPGMVAGGLSGIGKGSTANIPWANPDAGPASSLVNQLR